MDVTVFTTSVESISQIKVLTPRLNSLAGKGNWNFALDDSDRILRIVSPKTRAETAIKLLQQFGFECRELE